MIQMSSTSVMRKGASGVSIIPLLKRKLDDLSSRLEGARMSDLDHLSIQNVAEDIIENIDLFERKVRLEHRRDYR